MSDCPKYHPSSVTVERLEDGRYRAVDRSDSIEGRQYGPTCSTYGEAEAHARRRRGVIKAALTRRRNKLTREVVR